MFLEKNKSTPNYKIKFAKISISIYFASILLSKVLSLTLSNFSAHVFSVCILNPCLVDLGQYSFAPDFKELLIMCMSLIKNNLHIKIFLTLVISIFINSYTFPRDRMKNSEMKILNPETSLMTKWRKVMCSKVEWSTLALAATSLMFSVLNVSSYMVLFLLFTEILPLIVNWGRCQIGVSRD